MNKEQKIDELRTIISEIDRLVNYVNSGPPEECIKNRVAYLRKDFEYIEEESILGMSDLLEIAGHLDLVAEQQSVDHLGMIIEILSDNIDEMEDY